MAPAKKATVDKSTTIRAASRNKQRSQPSQRSSDSPFGSSSGASLASSLSSLFSPQPHGKDAALASLLASSSKPPVKLGQASSGLAAFGSFTNPQSQPSTSTAPKSLDEKQKDKREDVSTKTEPSEPAAASTSNAAQHEQTASSSKQTVTEASSLKDRMQKQTAKSASSSTAPVVPNVPAGRKPVFRPVLASSTAVSWPEMPIAGSKTVLHTLLELFAQPKVQATLYRDLGRRSRLRASKRADNDMDVDDDQAPSPELLAPPQVLAGINSITRAIEAGIASDLAKLQSKGSRTNVKQKAKEEIDSPPGVKVVFVCRHDVPQPMLVAHLPMLISARNAVLHASDPNSTEGVLLFALPSGSEPLLAKALNLRRASIVALTTAFADAHLKHILSAIQRETGSICQLRATWLETAIRSATQAPNANALPLAQQPTSIKLLRTTQPTDLNACKAAKRSKRKLRSANWKKRKMSALQRVKDLKAQLRANRKQRSKSGVTLSM
ncbi:uncharacterized protein SPSC_06510 [Sporisorium scitamineum]|uniref:Uncharacterized protein n=1 Tax=Sporisorium scitamineum TaxID=49012 RepID=A0A0F7SDT3_9BASI|nr:uncharacterized protein SPSC_06510 [Sporisorium scitamineum]CDW99393.1 hypothetical protein [Sporisorium scitamineum]